MERTIWRGSAFLDCRPRDISVYLDKWAVGPLEEAIKTSISGLFGAVVCGPDIVGGGTVASITLDEEDVPCVRSRLIEALASVGFSS